MRREDFTYTYNADAYTVLYKGAFVCGATVLLPRTKPLHWRHARANRENNKEACERTIRNILLGVSHTKRIAEIESVGV